MSSITDLPTEMTDRIFSFLPIDDQKNARLVCRQWYKQLSSSCFWKNAKTQIYPYMMLTPTAWHGLIEVAAENKIRCISVDDMQEITNDISNEGSTRAMVKATARHFQNSNRYALELLEKVLEDCSFSLEELCLLASEHTMATVFGVLGKMRRLRYLKVFLSAAYGQMPAVPRTGPKSVEFACVSHLEMELGREPCLDLLGGLASHLTTLTLCTSIFTQPDMLVRCLNEIHLPALRSLAVESHTQDNIIQPGQLGDVCWRMMSQLTELRCEKNFSLCNVMAEMLRHCQNLKCLVLEVSLIPAECLEQVVTLKELKDLILSVESTIGREPPLLELLELEKLHLATEINIRLGKHLPKLTSIVIEGIGQDGYTNVVLSKFLQIDGIKERRLQKLRFQDIALDMEAIDMLCSLSADLLSFEYCQIDGSLFDAIAKLEARRNFFNIEICDCIFIFAPEKLYSLRKVAELRTKCSYLQIADSSVCYEVSPPALPGCAPGF